MENQLAVRLAREEDARGVRTIGTLNYLYSRFEIVS